MSRPKLGRVTERTPESPLDRKRLRLTFAEPQLSGSPTKPPAHRTWSWKSPSRKRSSRKRSLGKRFFSFLTSGSSNESLRSPRTTLSEPGLSEVTDLGSPFVTPTFRSPSIQPTLSEVTPEGSPFVTPASTLGSPSIQPTLSEETEGWDEKEVGQERDHANKICRETLFVSKCLHGDKAAAQEIVPYPNRQLALRTVEKILPEMKKIPRNQLGRAIVPVLAWLCDHLKSMDDPVGENNKWTPKEELELFLGQLLRSVVHKDVVNLFVQAGCNDWQYWLNATLDGILEKTGPHVEDAQWLFNKMTDHGFYDGICFHGRIQRPRTLAAKRVRKNVDEWIKAAGDRVTVSKPARTKYWVRVLEEYSSFPDSIPKDLRTLIVDFLPRSHPKAKKGGVPHRDFRVASDEVANWP